MPCLLILPAALSSIFFLTGGVTAFVRKSSEKSLIPASIIAGAYGASAYLMTIKPYEFSGYITAVVTSVLAVAVGLYMLSLSVEGQVSFHNEDSGYEGGIIH